MATGRALILIQRGHERAQSGNFMSTSMFGNISPLTVFHRTRFGTEQLLCSCGVVERSAVRRQHHSTTENRYLFVFAGTPQERRDTFTQSVNPGRSSPIVFIDSKEGKNRLRRPLVSADSAAHFFQSIRSRSGFSPSAPCRTDIAIVAPEQMWTASAETTLCIARGCVRHDAGLPLISFLPGSIKRDPP